LKNLIRKILSEGWGDTSWVTDAEKISIHDVLNYLSNHKVYDIPVQYIVDTLDNPFTRVKTEPERILKADLSYPIVIVKKNGKLSYILDGNHRMTKAIEIGEDTIKSKILDLDNSNVPPVFKELF
tara:strand:- start:1610 stop:1984 length:375 start_codon:yes stop_codon:yes gene_type:complete